LVFLDGGMVPANQQQVNAQIIENFVPRADMMGLIKLLLKEGITDLDVHDFFYAFNGIDGLQTKGS
jgi:hypothetical protein